LDWTKYHPLQEHVTLGAWKTEPEKLQQSWEEMDPPKELVSFGQRHLRFFGDIRNFA
jgi:hypothetical protein